MVMIAYISKKPYNACFIQEIPVVTYNSYQQKVFQVGLYDSNTYKLEKEYRS